MIKTVFSDNELKILPQKWPFFLLLSIGILFLLLGTGEILFLTHFSPALGHLFIGIGLFVFFLGIILVLEKEDVVITINSSKGVIEVCNKTSSEGIHTAFPLDYFNRISIFRRVYRTSNQRMKVFYEVLLEKSDHTCFLLEKYKEKEEAFSFAEQLQHIILLDIYYMEKRHKPSDFKQKSPHIPEEIQLPEKSFLRKEQKEAEIILFWQGSHTFWGGILLLGMLYSIYHVIQWAGILCWGLPPVLGYVILGIGAAVLFLFPVRKILGTKGIRLGRESLVYFRKIGGLIINQKKMNWDDVGGVQNSVNFCADSLKVISGKGMIIYQEMVEWGDNIPPEDNNLIKKLWELKRQIISLDVATLPVGDRMRLEMEIRNFMLLE